MEKHFGVNVLSPLAFSERLFPLLKETARKSPLGSVRVVWVSSSAHYLFSSKEGVNFDSINGNLILGNNLLYGQSKLANIQLSNHFAKQMKDDGVVNLSLHPGNINSNPKSHSFIIGIIAVSALFESARQSSSIPYSLPFSSFTSLTIRN